MAWYKSNGSLRNVACRKQLENKQVIFIFYSSAEDSQRIKHGMAFKGIASGDTDVLDAQG